MIFGLFAGQTQNDAFGSANVEATEDMTDSEPRCPNIHYMPPTDARVINMAVSMEIR